MSFLTAEWRKLAFANYVINPEILKLYVPAGTELDFWDDKCFVSLVGFMFVNTKLLNVKIPGYVNFEEVNLRFYVKRIEGENVKRGVVFIKEIVPKPALTFVANTIYKENYETLPMKHLWNKNEQNLQVKYEWQKNQKWNSFQISAHPKPLEILPNSQTEFITEHYWGYAHVNEKKSIEYEVKHPKWKVYQVEKYAIDVDFKTVYGQNFEFLNHQKPYSVMLAEGSTISVERNRKIGVELV